MAWDEYVKDETQAHRGMPLEDLINLTNDAYRRDHVALIQKVPTNFLPIRGDRGKVVSCKVVQKSGVDYLGQVGGTPLAFEAKNSASDSILFSRVEPHQAAFLDDWLASGKGSLAFVLVGFKLNRFFLVPWEFWKAARDAWDEHRKTGEKAKPVHVEKYGWVWETPGMASVKADGLLPDWEVKLGGRYVLPYLEVVEKTKRRSG